jgi:hypothetical protein
MKPILKALLAMFLVLTAPIWVPFWLIAKFWRVFALLFLVGWLAGCTSTSNRFDKSPCACEFRLLDGSDASGATHV